MYKCITTPTSLLDNWRCPCSLHLGVAVGDIYGKCSFLLMQSAPTDSPWMEGMAAQISHGTFSSTVDYSLSWGVGLKDRCPGHVDHNSCRLLRRMLLVGIGYWLRHPGWYDHCSYRIPPLMWRPPSRREEWECWFPSKILLSTSQHGWQVYQQVKLLLPNVACVTLRICALTEICMFTVNLLFDLVMCMVYQWITGYHVSLTDLSSSQQRM